MNEPLGLRDFTRQMLDNIDNPSYVQPTFAPHIPTPQHIPMHARYVLPARKEHKVYTIPTMSTPSTMSPEARKGLDEFLGAVDVADVDEPAFESAREARNHTEKHFARIDEVNRVANFASKEKANAIRDAFRYKEVIPDGEEAKTKLRSLAIQEKFAVPNSLARNMQALCSYYNNKEGGKRFKTERAGGTTSMLIIWRTR
jgi:hypothetical protein